MLRPLKVDGPEATFRLVTDPALIALAVSPSKPRKLPIHSNKRRRVSGRRAEGGGKVGVEGKDNEGKEGTGEEDEEIYGTIAVRSFPEIPTTDETFQKQEPPLGDIYIEQLGFVKEREKGKGGLGARSITGKSADDGGLAVVSASVMGHRANREASLGHCVHSGISIDETVEGSIMSQEAVDQTTVEEGAEEGNYAESVDEEDIQRAIAKAIEGSNRHHLLDGVEEIEETIGDLEHPEERLQERGGGKVFQQSGRQGDLVILDDKNEGLPEAYGEEGTSRQTSYQADIIVIPDDEAEPNQSSVHPGSVYDGDTESEPGSGLEQEPELYHLAPTIPPIPESRSPTPAVKSIILEHQPRLQPLQLPLTPASIYQTPPPTRSSTHRFSSLASIGASSVSLAPLTGPARWKIPFVKKSRFSGPKIYTPLTLSPPSSGLGVVDHVRVPPRRDYGEVRWEGAKRQVSPTVSCLA